MLKKEDQKTYLSESQKKKHFPEDSIDVSKILAASGAENEKQEDGNKRKSVGDDEKQVGLVAKKSKTASADKDKNSKSILSVVLTVTGLKYADVAASLGEQVTLVPESNNVSTCISSEWNSRRCAAPEWIRYLTLKTLSFECQVYDKNAIRVDSGGEKVGHIKKDQAVKVSLILAKLKDKIAKKSVEVSAKITSAGNGFEQSLQVEITQKWSDTTYSFWSQ